MKVFTILLCILAGITAAWAVSVPVAHPGTGGTSLDQTWGPDTYGYRAKDSNEAGGPVYAWHDISTSGTAVTGLGDDNVVGPFPLGFSFHYYWYDVDQYYIGSNGYIKFSAGGDQLASPFVQFPTTTPPNDVIGPYVADWVFGGGEPSTCYRWTNNDDSLIVSWTSVVAWIDPPPNAGNHNFQVILSAVDSSITFMYGAQTGATYQDATTIGMENVTGQIGLSIAFAAYPTANSAIKIEYPDVVTYAIHDLQLAAVHNPSSAAIFLRPGSLFTPWMNVLNSGNQDEGNFNVAYVLRRANNQVAAQSSVTHPDITAGELQTVTFDNLWVVDTTRSLRAVATVTRPGDMIATNNMATGEVHAVMLTDQPVELAYDDGFADDSLSWAGGNGGMGNQFVPPTYPVEISSLRYFIWSNVADNFGAQILDDDGPNGGPGTVLFQATINAPTPQAWSVVDLPTPVEITSGSFYVAWLQTGTDMQLGLDSDAPPFSRRTWENTGATWAESRQNGSTEAMIRCTILDLDPAPQPFTRVAPVDSSVQDLQTTQVLHFAWRTAVDPNNTEFNYRVHVFSPDAVWFADTTITVATPDTVLDYTVPIPVDRSLDEIDGVKWSVVAVSGDDSTWAGNAGKYQGYFRIDAPGAVGAVKTGLVTEYAVSAYPNPFNPTTRIGYDLPQAGNVELKIYNLVGEEVTTLINGRHEAGRFTVEWNGSLAPSGTYFAVLHTSNATRVQKLLLLK
jgi:hypothetical protein